MLQHKEWMDRSRPSDQTNHHYKQTGLVAIQMCGIVKDFLW